MNTRERVTHLVVGIREKTSHSSSLLYASSDDPIRPRFLALSLHPMSTLGRLLCADGELNDERQTSAQTMQQQRTAHSH